MTMSRYATTQGTVTHLASQKGPHLPDFVSVRYVVDGTPYDITEHVSLHNTAIRFLGIPLGQKQAPRLGHITAGTQVRVRYRVDDPRQSFLPDNRHRQRW